MRIITTEGLNDHLKYFWDPESRHILLSPEQAKEILLRYLLSIYRERIIQLPIGLRLLEQIAIAEKAEGERFDFTATLEKSVEVGYIWELLPAPFVGKFYGPKKK